MPDPSPSRRSVPDFHSAVGTHFLRTTYSTAAPPSRLMPERRRSFGHGVALGQLLIGSLWVCTTAALLWWPPIRSLTQVIWDTLRPAWL